jgi:hypothetical protein
MRCLIFAKALRILGFYRGVIMKKKQLKKIKKIIGVLSAIVQEHEGREVRNMRMVLEVENKSSDELRAELAEGKALGEKISTEYQKLLKDWEEAGTCPMAHQCVGEGIEKAIKNSSVCLPRMQCERPAFTSIRDRTIWELRNSPSQQ